MSQTNYPNQVPEQIPSWDEIRAMFAKSREEDDRRRKEEDRRRVIEDRRRTENEARRLAENERLLAIAAAEDAKRKRENDRMLKELEQKIAGLGDKFGYFTEGLALPTMEKILMRKFGIESISPRMKFGRGGRNLEFDVFGLSAGESKRIVVVEVKSRVKYDSIQQFVKQLQAVRELMPEHDDKELMGILAGVHWDTGVEQQARDCGFYTARIRNDVFTLTSAKEFVPKHW